MCTRLSAAHIECNARVEKKWAHSPPGIQRLYTLHPLLNDSLSEIFRAGLRGIIHAASLALCPTLLFFRWPFTSFAGPSFKNGNPRTVTRGTIVACEPVNDQRLSPVTNQLRWWMSCSASCFRLKLLNTVNQKICDFMFTNLRSTTLVPLCDYTRHKLALWVPS